MNQINLNLHFTECRVSEISCGAAKDTTSGSSNDCPKSNPEQDQVEKDKATVPLTLPAV